MPCLLILHIHDGSFCSFVSCKIFQTTNVAKMVSEAWKNLSTEERDIWDEKARSDKERFEMEKSLYDGPWKVPATKSSKDPNAPKRPMSAFLAYSNSKRSAVKRENPGLTNAEVSRVLASLWRNADEMEKKKFIDEEFALRQKYKTSIADWRASEENEKDLLRRAREEMALRTVEAHKRQLEDENSGEALYRHLDPSSLPLLQLPPHQFASMNEGMDRGDHGRVSYYEHFRDDNNENPLMTMDHHHQPQPMSHVMNSPYGAYGADPSMQSRIETSAFNSAQSLYGEFYRSTVSRPATTTDGKASRVCVLPFKCFFPHHCFLLVTRRSSTDPHVELAAAAAAPPTPTPATSVGTKSSTQLTQRGTAKRSGGPESRAAICSWSVSRGLPTTTTIRAAPAAAR